MLGLGFASEWVRLNLLLYVFKPELIQWNWADDAQVVSSWGQENGHRPGHDDGMQNGFVAVAVDNHNVPARNR